MHGQAIWAVEGRHWLIAVSLLCGAQKHVAEQRNIKLELEGAILSVIIGIIMVNGNLEGLGRD